MKKFTVSNTYNNNATNNNNNHDCPENSHDNGSSSQQISRTLGEQLKTPKPQYFRYKRLFQTVIL